MRGVYLSLVTMYWRVSWEKNCKHRNQTQTALFETEAAAKKFGDQIWKEPKTLSVSIEGGFNSKGEKI